MLCSRNSLGATAVEVPAILAKQYKDRLQEYSFRESHSPDGVVLRIACNVASKLSLVTVKAPTNAANQNNLIWTDELGVKC